MSGQDTTIGIYTCLLAGSILEWHITNDGYGYGDGDGNGYGDDNGDGYGDGYGDGSGDGDGDGHG